MVIDDDVVYAALARRCVKNGEFLALRTSLGYTLRQVADQLGVDSAEVSRWSRGVVAPKREAPALGRLIATWMLMSDPVAPGADGLSRLAVVAARGVKQL